MASSCEKETKLDAKTATTIDYLKKDYENPYDDEAIAAYRNGSKVGYVANSVSTVCRGTYSAGRIYDRFDKEAECVVRFVSVECGFLVAEVNDGCIVDKI